MSSGKPNGVAVEIEEVTKRYGHVQALRSVSLTIEEGAFVAFLGSNGAGKTTLLKIIATHAAPSSGTVKIFGENAFRSGNKIRKRIGLVTHEKYLYDELTVWENLLFYARMFTLDESSVPRSIDLMDLRRWSNVPVGQLSYGLQKRTDIARALVHSPDLILLDEPFSGLDTTTCDLFLQHFLELKEDQKITLILSSHSLDWSRKLCDREVMLERGKILHATTNG